MKRKSVYTGVAWAAGLFTAACDAHILAVSVFMLLIAFLFKTLVRFNLKSIIFMLAVFAIAFGYFRAYDYTVYNEIISYSGEKIAYCGKITDVNDKNGNKSFYTLNGKINDDVNASLMLYIDSVNAEVDDVLSFECVPQTPENSYLFNSRDYYRAKGCYLSAYSAENLSIEPCGFSLKNMLYRFRESVSSAVETAIPERESAMIKGMLFGDKTGFEEDDKTILYRVGIGHVTAVSGFHLVMFCSAIVFILKKLRAGRITGFLLTELMMLLFVICCGSSPSVLRSFIMMTLINSAPLFFRRTDSLNSICIAVILLTLPNPFVILNQSFLLSVSGALGMGVFGKYMTANIHAVTFPQKLGKKLLHMLCVFIVTSPVTVLLTGEISFISPLTNLILVPLCMAALLIVMIGALLFWAEPVLVFELAGSIVSVVLNISDILKKFSFVYGRLSGDFMPYMLLALTAICIFGYLIFRSRRICTFLVAMCVFIVFMFSSVNTFLDRNTLKIALLGNNDAEVIVIARGKSADIIDVSGEYKNSRYAEKYLRELGVSTINNLILIDNISYSMVGYDNHLSLLNVENIVVPSGTYFNKSYTICGTTPKYSDFSMWSADYDDYIIKIDDGKINIGYGDYNFKYENGRYYGKKYSKNVAIHVGDDGEVKVRRLEDGGT